MLRRVRENVPVLLVPAAWTVVTAAHLGVVSARTLLIAHVVMDVVIVAFTALSWREMDSGVLLVWKVVLVAGLGVTLAGTVALASDPIDGTLAWVAVVGWILLPAGGLAYTGTALERNAPWVYSMAAIACSLGGLVYLSAPALGLGLDGYLAGLVLVGAGQTAGIANAVYQY